MKSRSSTGVGQKIDLEYNIETMRITDEGGEDEGFNKRPTASFMDQIKAKSSVAQRETVDSNTGEISKVTADIQSNKLKQLLGQIKST